MIKLENYQDILKTEGILAKGFGIIPKFVMLDNELSLEAKTIYAYFSSYVGSGEVAFPSRATILRHLQISKDRYYRHYNQLLEQGYILVEQQLYTKSDTGENRLGKNIYTLLSNPKKFKEYKENQELENPTLKGKSMRNYGYGTIPKIVMFDERLDIKSKGIYAYFSSYAGAGEVAFPELKDTLFFLDLSEPTYYRYINELIKYNYLVIEQRKIEGKFNINDYYLVETPDEENVKLKKSPFPKNKDTGESVDTSRFNKVIHNKKSPFPKNKDTGNKDTQNEDTGNKDTYIINNNTINSINNKQSINQDKQNELINDISNSLLEKVKQELLEEKQIPYNYVMDRTKMEMAIKLLISYYEDEIFYKENLNINRTASYQLSISKLFVNSLTDLLTTQGIQKINNAHITYAKVYDKVTEYIKENPYSSIGISLETIYELSCDKYHSASLKSEILNPVGYMKAIIWSALLEGDSKLKTDVNRYFEGY